MKNYSSLSPQAYSVLDEIKYQYNYVFINRLAFNLSIPLASVRRSLGELRAKGFNVETRNGVVRLARG